MADVVEDLVAGSRGMTQPLAIDLFCGLFGWSDGLLAEGWDIIGFDIEDMHAAFNIPRPPEKRLVIQDVLTLHGSQFKNAALFVASPPCQEFSYMAMPWKRAKAKAVAIRADDSGKSLANLTALFDACFRIQAQASLAAGRHIPMVVENVRGAIPWVGRSRWNFGSFHLWGDVPALMPIRLGRQAMKEGIAHRQNGATNFHGYNSQGIKGAGASWDAAAGRSKLGVGHWTSPHENGTKNGKGWFSSGDDCSEQRRHGSKSTGRKAASAMIAKIPLTLSRHIAATYYPTTTPTAQP